MEINHRQQDKFSAEESSLWINQVDGSKRNIDFVEIEKALKDFCFIRHELSNYSYLYASQLSFDIHLNLPYWEYLFINGQINKSEKDELEEGALLTIYLLFKEIYEAEGWCYIYKHSLFDIIYQSIALYKPDNVMKQEMLEKIRFSQQHYANEQLSEQSPVPPDPESERLIQILQQNDEWVHFQFVEKYYINKANSFGPARQNTKAFIDQLKNSGRK